MQVDADDVAGDASRNIPVLHGNRPKGMPKTFMKSFAKKTTISWLRENYQLSEQHTTAIETMYHDYRAFSASQNLPSATRPIFGKIVRLAFPGVIKCRRGKRGSTLRHFTLTRRPSSSSQLRHPQQQASSEPQIYSNPSELSSSSPGYAYSSSSSSTSSQLAHPQPHPHSLPPSLPGSESTEHLWRKLLDDIRQDKKAPSSLSPPTSSSSTTTISRSYPFNPSGIKLERTSLDAGCFAEDGSDNGYGAAAGRGGSSSPSHSDSASGRSSPGPLFESGSSSIEPTSALPFSTSYSNDYFRWLSLPAQEEQDSYEQPQQAHWFYGKETTNTVNERPLPAPYYRAGWPQPTPATTATSGDYKYNYSPSSSSSSLRMSSGGNVVTHCSCPQCRCSCYHCTNHLRA
ncbi:hypothetical protein QOT17_019733 [Balamuthia mandrillaris]